MKTNPKYIPIHKIESVQAHDDYTVTLIFKNGEVKRFDVKPFLNGGEFFGKLNDPAYFRSVVPDGCSIEWPHGQSFCSDTLYPFGISVDD